MKTYEGFLLEGISDKVGGMSDDQFNQFMKGRTEEEAKTYRDARQKAKGGDKKDKRDKNPGGPIVVRKTDKSSPGNGSTGTQQTPPRSGDVTGGLGPKSRSSNAPSVEPKKKRETIHRYMPRTVIPQKDELEKRKEKEKEKRQKEKGKGKGLNLGIRDKLVGAATELAKTETNKDVQTYEAKPVA